MRLAALAVLETAQEVRLRYFFAGIDRRYPA